MIYTNRFFDLVRTSEARRVKTVEMPLADAKALQHEISKLLIALQEQRTDQPPGIDGVEISGDTW